MTAMDVDTNLTVANYLSAVRAALADLPASERDDLLEDLERHLEEVAAETGEPLEVRLGTPAAYAAELRASAGYGGPVAPPALPERVLGRMREVLAHPRLRPLLELAREAEPGWWVARGAVFVVAAAVLWSDQSYENFPVPELWGSRVLTLLVLGATCAVSVRVGRQWRHGPRGAANVAISLIVVVLGLATLMKLEEQLQPRYVTEFVREPSGELRAVDGRPIFNIYPFAADGTPLEGVLLYDQDGVPITNVADTTASGRPLGRRYPSGADGSAITNSYPQQVILPPGREPRERPDQRPAVTVPSTTTTTAPSSNTTSTTATTTTTQLPR